MRDVPDERAALAASGARTIADYGSFTLVEAAGDGAERLRDAGSDQRDDMREVRLRGRPVDPAADRAPFAAKGRRAPSGDALVLVQFVGPVKDAWLKRLRATGVSIVTYMAQNAYLVHGSGDELDALARLAARDASVRAATPFAAADKLAPGVAAKQGRAAFEVQTLAGGAGSDARRSLAARGRALRRTTRGDGVATQFVAADAAAVRDLARDPAVVAVLPHVVPELRDERAAQIVAGNLTGGATPSGTGYLAWLTSQGFGTTTFDFAVDVTDEGIDTATLPGAHPDFYEGGSTSNPTRVAYKTNWTADADARDCGGHGTNVASIATGFNDATGASVEDGDGYNYGLGVAPRAQVGASKIFRCTGAFSLVGTFTDLVSSAYANGARISNNSWGADVAGQYNADSQDYDRLVRDARPGVAGNQEIVELFANGNAGPGTGTVGSPGTAKNVISVGASESVRAIGANDGCGVSDTGANDARDIIGFSSRGPTDDGRTKPDVVAPGTHVTGAQPQTGADYNGSGTCNPQFPSGSALYSLVSGTSQATPEASGFAALIRDHYRRTVGGGTTPPSPAMTKAIMVNSATDLAGGVDGGIGTIASRPNNSQGWGRIDAGGAFDSTARHHTDQTVLLDASGDVHARSFGIADTTRPVRVSLAWTDPPGPTTGNAYVNDLNLTVTAGGQTYKGNVFSGGQSATGGTADPRNNVENVFLPAGTSGTMTVTVTGTNVAGDGVPGVGDATDQDFALVVSNANVSAAPVLAHGETTATEGSDGDGDGVVEGGESVNVSQRVRNVGDATATGVAGTLTSGAAGVTVTQGSSSYPDLPAGASGTNATPFRAALATSVPCGRRVELSLSLTRAGSAAATVVPVSVQTGRPGPLRTTTSPDVPRAIPDDNASGVTSTVSIPTTGLVSDVDVRIGSISHSWVGDLRIQITAPDGAVVTLADRPGGVNNDGDNLTSTIFDDEAATAIGAAGTSAPYTGRFRPQGDHLSRLDGRQLRGTWTLRVADLESADTGTLTSWGADAGAFECPVPANAAPTAAFAAGPSPALTGQTVSFDASASSDPDGTIARYQWDLDGDGSFETDTGAVPAAARAYADAAPRTVRLRVTDDDGASAETQRTLEVRDGTRPRISLSRLTNARISALLRRRTTVRATCDEPCTMTFRLAVRVRQPGSRRARAVTVATGRARITRARRVVRVRIVPTRAGRRTLPRLRSARATLTARAVDGARNARTARRTVRLRR